MDKILHKTRQTFAIAIYSVKQRLTSPRVICLLVIFGVFVCDNMSFADQAAELMDLRINPLLYPFLASDVVKQLVIFAGVIFLYSDAPFINKSQPYVIIRSKRTVWALGQILHIIIFSAVYFFILMAISFVVVIPHATFSTDGWGRLATILAESNLTSQLDMNFLFPEKIVTAYSPGEAFILTFLLNWALASFFGTLMFALNLNFGKMAGPAISSTLVLMDLLIVNYPFVGFECSPVSMSRLSVLDPLGVSNYPSPTYAFCFYTIGILIFSVIIILSIKRKSIEISSES